MNVEREAEFAVVDSGYEQRARRQVRRPILAIRLFCPFTRVFTQGVPRRSPPSPRKS